MINSNSNSVTEGVPQGLVLGPELLVLYVNDIDSEVLYTFTKYADGHSILILGRFKSITASVP